ncbi:MAG TPA: phosphate ABC transporter substrate-binding protein PstS [Steroidobacteraceae bacterium]|nr:phosphate ABC transporter substrate-binding protein PstS [Steroidobacteraceae bacterium]
MIDRHSSARRCARICSAIGIAGVLLAALLPGSGTARAADQMRLLETGSSLLYPLFNLWVPAYSSSHPDVQITTQSTGSGTGISEAISGIAQVGASDAYMSNPQMHANRSMLNIPLAISSQMVNYNVPGLNDAHLKLSGPVLAAIYSGTVQYWDDAQLRSLNPGVNLPHQSIVPIHRTDGSGDTFIFTQYLAFSTPSWNQSIAYGTTVAWPAVSGGLGAEGNPGMVNASKTTPYSIAYIGISFKKATDAAGLGEAALQNRAGEFVLPTAATVQAAVRATAARTPADERISLIFAPGAQSYPIINYEYAIVNSRQPSRAQGTAVRQLLDWCINPRDGNAAHFMDAVGFVALPEAIAQLSRKQIAMIH